jgi:hypothetical protein
MSRRKGPTKIVRDLPEYGDVEHQLQIVLNAPRMVIDELFDLRNPRSNAEFLATARSQIPQNVAVVFIPISEVSQTAEEIHLRGLQVDPVSGLRARALSLNIDRSAEWIEVLRVTLALGKVINYQSAEYIESRDAPFRVPTPTSEALKGCDSLCASDESEYIVFKSSQVQCCNLVRFRGRENLTQTEEEMVCDLCREREAVIWCVNDAAKFCAECHELSHTNTVQQAHRWMSVQEGRGLMEFCPAHKDLHVEYYCDLCKIPVCIKCKMVGSHARGDCAVHELRPIRSSYDEAVTVSAEPYPIVTRRTKEIEAKLKETDRAMDEVWKNTADVIEEIERIAEQAKARAKELSGEKLLALRSVRTELIRKKSDIDAMTKLLKVHRDHSGPLTFLQAFHRQNLLATALQEQTKKGNDQESSDLPPPITVHGDLKVTARITVRQTGIVPEEEEQHEEEEGEITIERAPQLCPPSPTSPLRRRGPSDSEFASLRALAEKRRERARSRGLSSELSFDPFKESQILRSAEIRSLIYACCPFKGQPFTRLLYSTTVDEPSIATMHERIDNIGITIVLLQRGPYQFGGFAALKWRKDGRPFGERGSSFLFSITRDAHLPLCGDGRPGLFATEDSLSFGKSDLVLAENFDNCTSEIGHSYGVQALSPVKGDPEKTKVRTGFTPGTADAENFLAGKPKFRPDIVEVWGFFTYDK